MKIFFDVGEGQSKVSNFKPENNLCEYTIITDELRKISLDNINSKMKIVKNKLQEQSTVYNVLSYTSKSTKRGL